MGHRRARDYADVDDSVPILLGGANKIETQGFVRSVVRSHLRQTNLDDFLLKRTLNC